MFETELYLYGSIIILIESITSVIKKVCVNASATTQLKWFKHILSISKQVKKTYTNGHQ